MKRLVFKEVSILSKVEKAARTQTFGPSINLLTGENDVGKSTLIKSLYHTLGADVLGLQNSQWKNAKPIYCVRFSLDGTDYTVIRDEKYFGVFDANQKLLGKFVGIAGAKGISHFINPLLDFRIELQRAEGENSVWPVRPFIFCHFKWIKMKAGPRVGALSADYSSSAITEKTCSNTISVSGRNHFTTLTSGQ